MSDDRRMNQETSDSPLCDVEETCEGGEEEKDVQQLSRLVRSKWSRETRKARIERSGRVLVHHGGSSGSIARSASDTSLSQQSSSGPDPSDQHPHSSSTPTPSHIYRSTVTSSVRQTKVQQGRRPCRNSLPDHSSDASLDSSDLGFGRSSVGTFGPIKERDLNDPFAPPPSHPSRPPVPSPDEPHCRSDRGENDSTSHGLWTTPPRSCDDSAVVEPSSPYQSAASTEPRLESSDSDVGSRPLTYSSTTPSSSDSHHGSESNSRTPKKFYTKNFLKNRQKNDSPPSSPPPSPSPSLPPSPSVSVSPSTTPREVLKAASTPKKKLYTPGFTPNTEGIASEGEGESLSPSIHVAASNPTLGPSKPLSRMNKRQFWTPSQQQQQQQQPQQQQQQCSTVTPSFRTRPEIYHTRPPALPHQSSSSRSFVTSGPNHGRTRTLFRLPRRLPRRLSHSFGSLSSTVLHQAMIDEYGRLVSEQFAVYQLINSLKVSLPLALLQQAQLGEEAYTTIYLGESDFPVLNPHLHLSDCSTEEIEDCHVNVPRAAVFIRSPSAIDESKYKTRECDGPLRGRRYWWGDCQRSKVTLQAGVLLCRSGQPVLRLFIFNDSYAEERSRPRRIVFCTKIHRGVNRYPCRMFVLRQLFWRLADDYVSQLPHRESLVCLLMAERKRLNDRNLQGGLRRENEETCIQEKEASTNALESVHKELTMLAGPKPRAELELLVLCERLLEIEETVCALDVLRSVAIQTCFQRLKCLKRLEEEVRYHDCQKNGCAEPREHCHSGRRNGIDCDFVHAYLPSAEADYLAFIREGMDECDLVLRKGHALSPKRLLLGPRNVIGFRTSEFRIHSLFQMDSAIMWFSLVQPEIPLHPSQSYGCRILSPERVPPQSRILFIRPVSRDEFRIFCQYVRCLIANSFTSRHESNRACFRFQTAHGLTEVLSAFMDQHSHDATGPSVDLELQFGIFGEVEEEEEEGEEEEGEGEGRTFDVRDESVMTMNSVPGTRNRSNRSSGGGRK